VTISYDFSYYFEWHTGSVSKPVWLLADWSSFCNLNSLPVETRSFIFENFPKELLLLGRAGIFNSGPFAAS
jgi:hypothetical protein